MSDTSNSDPKQQPSRLALHSSSITTFLIVALVTVSLAIGGLLGGIAGGGLVLWATGNQAALWPQSPEMSAAVPVPVPALTPTPSAAPTGTPTPSATPTSSIIDSVGRVLPAVVTIVNRQSGLESQGKNADTRIRGSGTIVDVRGYIATNYHVVQEAGQLTVILDSGQELAGRLIAVDTEQDMALVRVENGNLSAATWGDSEAVRLGEWAIAIGSALGDLPSSVTVGVVSGLGRSLELDGNVTMRGLIQTDAAINKGNSGGPLVNQRGEVIGINTFIIRDSGRVGVAEGIGFAIPSSLARRLVGQWIAADAP